MEWHWINENPVTAVAKFKEPRGRARFLSDDERTRLLEACKASEHPWLYPVVILALSTGMRAGEVMGLTWDRVDLQRGRITLQETKNGEVRVVPLTGLALQLLRQHEATRRDDTELLWPGRRKPPRPIVLRKHWLAALDAAGIQDFRFHDLRHSACAYLLMSGATIPELAEVLGHKTLQMVKRYSHISEQHATGLVERMNSRIFPGTGE
jgi:integrase